MCILNSTLNNWAKNCLVGPLKYHQQSIKYLYATTHSLGKWVLRILIAKNVLSKRKVFSLCHVSPRFSIFIHRQRWRRTKTGVSRWDRAHEANRKASKCFEFCGMLDNDKTTSSCHRVCSSRRSASVADKQEATGNIFKLKFNKNSHQ